MEKASPDYDDTLSNFARLVVNQTTNTGSSQFGGVSRGLGVWVRRSRCDTCVKVSRQVLMAVYFSIGMMRIVARSKTSRIKRNNALTQCVA